MGFRRLCCAAVCFFSVAAVIGAESQVVAPVWELGKSALAPVKGGGMVAPDNGVVVLDGTNAFEIPASVLGEQKDFTIEFEFKRGDHFQNLPRTVGGLRLFSNRDAEEKAGLSLMYLPPEWDRNGGVSNVIGIETNTYWNGECAGLDGNGFNKWTFLVKSGLGSIYRNGLLIAMTGEIKPSKQPLKIGGLGWRGIPKTEFAGKPFPVPYEMKNLRIYNTVVFPTGYDKSAEVMRNCSGESYTMQRANIKDPSLPRILVIGDSISMAYRGFITQHYKGRAYVDYWVGGSWFDPKSVAGEDSAAKRPWKGVLANGPYDVITWNAMTLHMWNMKMMQRCPEESLAPNMSEMVEFLQKTAPQSKIVWIRCTPARENQPDGTPTLKNAWSERIANYNAIVDGVMKKYGIPEVDLWDICEAAMPTIKKNWADTVHWDSVVSKQMADRICLEIDKYLPVKTPATSTK